MPLEKVSITNVDGKSVAIFKETETIVKEVRINLDELIQDISNKKNELVGLKAKLNDCIKNMSLEEKAIWKAKLDAALLKI